MIRKNKLRGVFILCAIFVLCAGCSRKAEEKENVKQTVSPTAQLSNSLNVDVEVFSLNQVNLSWNQLRDATRYVIVREELENDDPEIPGPAIGRTQLAELSGQETSYKDTTAKAGSYYQYNIYAYSGSSGQDSDQQEEKGIYLTSKEEIVQVAIEGVYWETDNAENIITSPSSITIMTCFNNNHLKMVEPSGLEIYRGDHLSTMELLADVPVSQEELIQKDGEKGIRYVDENVEAGKGYYYQARAYVEVNGKREYGYSSNYLHKSAILPEGDFSMKFVQATGKNFSAELSLQSNSSGNAELQFIGNQFQGLVDYVYRKEGHSYESLPMCLKEYRLGNGKWMSYQEQPLCLKGGEKIDLRIVPQEEDETFLSPKDNWKSAEIILMVKYDGVPRNLHFDLKENQALITETGSETGRPVANANIVNDFEINHKGDHQANSVPDAVIAYLESNYEDMLIEPVYTKKKDKNCPDGVEIYRSRDNKNFSLVGTVEYPEYGAARYSDSSVLAGDKFYYKVRNYIDTDNNRIYGKYSESVRPFLATYYGGKYKMWIAEGETVEQQDSMVVGFYSYSLANPALHFDDASCEWGGKTLPLVIREYSLDGIHWKKKWKSDSAFRLSAKKTVYLKVELEEKQQGFVWKNVDSIELNTFFADETSWFIDFRYDIKKDKMLYVLSRDD